MDLEKVRADFPVTKNSIYLENAGFSPTPLPIARAVYEYLEEAGSGFTTQFIGKTLDMAADTRSRLAEFLHAKSEEVAIIRNTAEAATHVASGLRWEAGSEIIISEVEHPSNWLPWARLQEIGVKTVVAPVRDDGRCDPEDFHKLINKKTRLIALNHIPSPSGIIQPCEAVGKLAHDSGVLFYVDAAQSAGQIDVDVGRLNCDFLAFTCAKFMCAPQGTGVFWISEEMQEKVKPFSVGWFNIDHDSSQITLGDFKNRALDAQVKTKGTAEAFEAPGTPPWSLMAGLGRAVRYLDEVGGIGFIEERLRGFGARMVEELQGIPKIKVYGTKDRRHRGGTIAFNMEGVHPVYLSALLLRVASVVTAPKPWGYVRASPHFYNSDEEIRKFVDAVKLVATKDLKFFSRTVVRA